MMYKNFTYKSGNAYIDWMMKNSLLYTLELCRDNNIFFEDETEMIEDIVEFPKEDIVVLIPDKNISRVALGKLAEMFPEHKAASIRPIGLFQHMICKQNEEESVHGLWMKMPNFLFDTAFFLSWADLNKVMRKCGINDLHVFLPSV